MKIYLIYETRKGYKDLILATTDREYAKIYSKEAKNTWPTANYRVYEVEDRIAKHYDYTEKPIIINGIEQQSY